MSFITGVGKANVDMLYGGMPRVPGEGEEIYAQSFSLQLGGGIPATLITLGRLQVPCRIQTFLGDDMFSRFAREQFQHSGVAPTTLPTRSGIPVNITSAVITPRDRAFISYSDDMPVTDDMRETVLKESEGAAIALVQDDFLPIYPKLRAGGTLLVYDTGWRDDMSEESMCQIMSLVDYYTPNAREAMKITRTQTPLDAARALSKYLKNPVVKLDREGCLLLENGEPIVVPAVPNVECVDSTGAGDAFLAGFCYGLYHHAPLSRCVLYGNITGGECVKGIGCLSRYVNAEELEKRALALESAC